MGSLFDVLGNQAADLKAIDEYIERTDIKTPAAGKLKQSWILWYTGLSAYQRNVDGDTVKEATNRRNAFNVANTVNPDELKRLQNVLATGLTREEMQGQPRIADSAGNYPKAAGITVASAAKGSVPKGARPTIRQGSVGEAVTAWQTLIGLPQSEIDGKFGPKTKTATIAWQTKHGLTADGVVGTASWTAALGGKDADPMPFAQAATTPVAPVGNRPTTAPTGQVAQTASLNKPIVQKSIPKPMPIVAKKAAEPVKVVKGNTPNVNPDLRKDVGVPADVKPVATAKTFLEGKGNWVAGAVGFLGTALLKKLF